MFSINAAMGRALILAIASVLAAGPSLAEKPEWAGGGKEGKHQKKEKHGKKQDEGPRQDIKIGAYFGDQQRQAVHLYYGERYRAGRCPPGLAKKNNGCMPPGQAKKWAIGQPLPHDVIFYPVPAAVVVQLGAPPAGHKYVRVAADILLIAVGTSMVVDAIQDLGRL